MTKLIGANQPVYIELDERLPMSKEQSQTMSIIRGARYEFLITDDGLIGAYFERIGFIERLFCCKKTFMQMTDKSMSKVH